MRSYCLVAVIVLLCSVAAAQQVGVYARVLEPQSDYVSVYLSQYNPSVTYFFDEMAFVQGLSVFGYPYCSGSSSLYVCAYFDDNADDVYCVSFDDYADGYHFPHPPISASSVTFFYQGFAQYCSGTILRIDRLDWTGGPGVVFNKNLYQVDASRAVSLGKVSSFMDAGGNTVFTNTSDSRLVSWFSEQGLLSPTSRTSTTNPGDELLICTNFDLNNDGQGNPVCDFVDSRECILKDSEWFMGDCCGDSPYSPCAFHSDKQAICGRDSQQYLRWAALSRVGQVVDLTGCPGVELVSNGSRFFTCSEPPSGFPMIERFQGSVEINGHEYMCVGSRIAECGGDFPVSGSSTGDKQVVGSTVYYCSEDANWLVSLDDAGKKSCESAGLAWTGSKCCGETSDSLETYEDSGGSGSCFKNIFVASGHSVPGSREIISYQGVFQVCRTNGIPQLFDNTGIVPAESTPCSAPLPDALASGSERNALCMPWGGWRFVGDTSTRFRKDTEWSAGIGEHKEGCCTESQCWDGNSCVDRGTIIMKGGKGFRCE